MGASLMNFCNPRRYLKVSKSRKTDDENTQKNCEKYNENSGYA
jgi:hypothetical protein